MSIVQWGPGRGERQAVTKFRRAVTLKIAVGNNKRSNSVEGCENFKTQNVANSK